MYWLNWSHAAVQSSALTVTAYLPSLIHSNHRLKLGTFCSAALLGGAPLILLSNILLQVHLAIATGSGTWTLSSGLWDLLKNVLTSITQHIGGFILNGLSTLDCFLCAISGNQVGGFLCLNNLFDTLKDVIVLLQTAAALIIDFAVDTLELIVEVIYYFFTLQFVALFQVRCSFSHRL